MNNQAINRSDTIMQKLGNLKSVINHNSNQNLNDYLQNERLNSSEHHDHQSYRKSLQKKLQRLFKEQKQMFSEGASLIQNHESQASQGVILKNPQGFTVDKMQGKIRQLERKYLNLDQPQKQRQNFKQRQFRIERETSKMKKSKNISSSMRLGTNDRSSKISPNKRKTVESHVEDKRLKLELASIKKEIANLNKLNSALVERLDYKEEQKRSRKIQSKQVLKQILQRLEDIRCKMVTGNCKKKSKEQKQQHIDLMVQLEEVTRHLKRQVMEKQLLEQKNVWIQNQLKQLNAQ